MIKSVSQKIALLCAGIALGVGAAYMRHGPQSSKNAAALAVPAESSAAAGSSAAPWGTTNQLKTILSQNTEREAILWFRTRCRNFASKDYAAAAADLTAVGLGRYEKLAAEVMENWGRLAPADALAFMESIPQGIANGLFVHLATGWAYSDAGGLLAWARLQSLDSLRYEAVVSALAPYRPEEAFSLKAKTPPNHLNNTQEEQYSVLHELARTDPNRAVGLLSSLPEQEQKAAISPLFLGWSRSDPDVALAWVSSLPRGPIRESAFESIVQLFTLSSPAAAAKLALQELDSSKAAESVAFQLINRWMETDADAARRFIEEQPDSPFKSQALSTVDYGMATRDPRAFLDSFLDQQDFSREASRWSLSAAMTFAKNEPEKYAQWLSDNVQNIPPDRLAGFIRGPAISQPELAAKLLALLPEGKMADRTYGIVASQWAQNDLGAAREFIASLPQGSAKDHFTASVIGSLARNNLDAALSEAMEHAQSPSFKQVFSNIMSNARSKGEVAAWALTLPEGLSTPALYKEIVSSWSNSDAKATASWINNLSEGAAKQASIQAYAEKTAAKNPTTAIEWATRLSDERQQERTLTYIARQWLSTDKTAAVEWVRQSNLSESMKSQLLNQ